MLESKLRMIGKISKSGSFKKLVEYLDKDDAVVLGTNMYGQGSRELTAEFMAVNDLNPGIKQPVLHASLSLSPGESLSDEQFREACENWMEKMGFDLSKNQYLIVRHKDTEHEHAHLAINRIDMVSGKVVVDSFERYRSQEIVRQLERNYGLERVAPSWQTFKNLERNLEQNLELSERQQLAASIERATLGSPTMPEFFQRLAERQIRASVSFTRTGKPKGITYQAADQEKVAGNALGKAYSFPGLQKYLKVNYDPARDNRELAEIVQSARQQHQELQQSREPAREELELQTPHSQMLTVSDQPLRERKPQPVWSPQYGIPDIQDLIKAIPENLSQPPDEIPALAHRQPELAQAAYQQWALLARAIYRVEEPRDVDQRIAFLMQSEQQSPSQITQVLAQSPAVQELLTRASTYAQSYSEFCQSQASDNQPTWQAELDQYLRAVETLRQRQQQLAATHQAQPEPKAAPAPNPDGYLEKEIQAGRNQLRSESRLPQITDAQLLAAERRVALYFQAAPTNPTDQQLAQAKERHQKKLTTAATANQEYRRSEQELESASIVDKLRPGYREKRKEAAKLAARFIGASEEMNRTQSELNKLEQQRHTFYQWQTSPQTREMERLRDYLSSPEAQTRLHDIKAQQVRELAREIEQKRLEQQRQPQPKPEHERDWGMSL